MKLFFAGISFSILCFNYLLYTVHKCKNDCRHAFFFSSMFDTFSLRFLNFTVTRITADKIVFLNKISRKGKKKKSKNITQSQKVEELIIGGYWLRGIQRVKG